MARYSPTAAAWLLALPSAVREGEEVGEAE